MNGPTSSIILRPAIPGSFWEWPETGTLNGLGASEPIRNYGELSNQ